MRILSVLEKRPTNFVKTFKSYTRSVTSLARPQDVNLENFHKIGFHGNFSIFPEAKCIPNIEKLTTICGKTVKIVYKKSISKTCIRSYSLLGSIFCLGIYMPVSKPSICFWKQVISNKWWEKLIFTTSVWQVIEKVHVVYGSWFSWKYEPLLSVGIGGPRVFARDLKAFCETGYNSVLLNIIENMK